MDSDYATLHALRSKVYPHFDDDQKRMADAISSVLLPLAAAGLIRHVVDLGCGTGEVLRRIAEKLTPYNGKVSFLGIDNCKNEIQLAKQLKIKNCIFICKTVDDLIRSAHFQQINFDWTKTVVLCIGHTLPHFPDVKSLITRLYELEVAYVMYDLHQGWDNAIDVANAGKTYRSPKNIFVDPNTGDLQTYVLITRPGKIPTHRIERGIAKLAEGRLEDCFITTQESLPKQTLNKLFIENSKFIAISSSSYRAGYGPMDAYFFARLDPIGDVLNKAYYDILEQAIPIMMSSKAIIGPSGMLKIKVPVVIMPFDGSHVFARYVDLNAKTKPNASSACKTTMYVGRPFSFQTKYPTAFGLYKSLLAPVSSAVVMKLIDGIIDGASSFDIAAVDRDFGKSEADLFRGSGKDKSFFIVPVYFGTLPLFCVVATFSSRLKIDTTDHEVYTVVLRNLGNAINAEVRAQIQFLIQEFVERAIGNVQATQKVDSDVAASMVKDAFDKAMSKPWKSWLLTIPTVKIGRLARVQKESHALIQIRDNAINTALSDPITRIANWFDSESFFEGDRVLPNDGNKDPHDVWLPNVHEQIRLPALLSRANAGSLNDLPTARFFGSTASGKAEIYWATQNLQRAVQLGKGNINDQGDATRLYQDLKHVFCRGHWTDRQGNQRKLYLGYRFSVRRLRNLLSIYGIEATMVSTLIGSQQAEDIKGHVEKDPTSNLVDLALWANNSRGDPTNKPTVSIEVSMEPDGESLNCQYILKFTNQILGTGGGDDFKKINRLIRSLNETFPIPDSKFSKTIIKLAMKLAWDDSQAHIASVSVTNIAFCND